MKQGLASLLALACCLVCKPTWSSAFVSPPVCSSSSSRMMTSKRGTSPTMMSSLAATAGGLPKYETLSTIDVLRADTGAAVKVTDAWKPRQGAPVVVAFFTHFGDFNSWELAQKLVFNNDEIERRGATVVGVGIGTLEGARLFSRETGFPLDQLLVDTDGTAYKALDFYQGFQGGGLPVPSPYLKLLPMLAGIGSPGTIREVLKGYTGDRGADAAWTGSVLSGMVQKERFDYLGTKGARPFEVATVRLQNMVKIVKQWPTLSPPDKELITQQGGTLIFDGKDVLWEFNDKGILVYTDVQEVLKVLGE